MPNDLDGVEWALHGPNGTTLWTEVEPGTPPEDWPWPMSDDEARIILERARFVDPAPNGISPHLVAFRILSDSAEAFERMAESGSTAGQLYALCGLQLLHSARFEEVKERLMSSAETVEVRSGSGETTQLVSTVAVSNCEWIDGTLYEARRRHAECDLNVFDELANPRINASHSTVTALAMRNTAP